MVYNIAPPGHKFAIIHRVTYCPIHLWRNKVDYSLIEPFHDVDILAAVVIVVAVRTFGDAVFVGKALVGVGGALRGLSEAHPWLGFGNHGVEFAHEVGHVLASPVGLTQRAACVNIAVVVACIFAHGGAIVVVIVEEHAVDIIFGDYLFADFHYMVLHIGSAGIEYATRTALYHPSVFHISGAIAGATARCAGVESVRIDPCVALQAALMALGYEKFKRVPSGIFATGACEPTCPRLIARLIHGVAHAAHLKVHCIKVVHRKRVEHAGHLVFLGLYRRCSAVRGALRPVDAPHCGYPCRAHLALGGYRIYYCCFGCA